MATEASPYIQTGTQKIEHGIKRVLDCIVAFFSLIVFSPLMLICYIAIKREDGGSAIFKQERIGRFGKPFYIYKFRSMRLDAEENGESLYQHENDTRVTKVGKFLRDHHLDELPQLWNVFKGDMAFIGPRPNANSISTRLWSATRAMPICTRFVRCNVIRDTLQRLYGHDGEDVEAFGVRPLLFGAPFLVVRHQDSRQYFPEYCYRKEVLDLS